MGVWINTASTPSCFGAAAFALSCLVTSSSRSSVTTRRHCDVESIFITLVGLVSWFHAPTYHGGESSVCPRPDFVVVVFLSRTSSFFANPKKRSSHALCVASSRAPSTSTNDEGLNLVASLWTTIPQSLVYSWYRKKKTYSFVSYTFTSSLCFTAYICFSPLSPHETTTGTTATLLLSSDGSHKGTRSQDACNINAIATLSQ